MYLKVWNDNQKLHQGHYLSNWTSVEEIEGESYCKTENIFQQNGCENSVGFATKLVELKVTSEVVCWMFSIIKCRGARDWGFWSRPICQTVVQHQQESSSSTGIHRLARGMDNDLITLELLHKQNLRLCCTNEFVY